ncbi:Hypothetical predicted protein [Pelobates cultripes]|uniref:Uncharacterized protein n=1 Tax=Pelobates cultripes TaxID=61616 RepID=A0AAD1T1S8_PELCU|nr:Hypothetical predicted protein [Pelobates cultripes]
MAVTSKAFLRRFFNESAASYRKAKMALTSRQHDSPPLSPTVSAASGEESYL